MAVVKKKGRCWQRKGQGKVRPSPPEYKDSVSDAAATSDDQKRTTAASSDITKTTS